MSLSMVGGRTGLLCWFAGGEHQAVEMSGLQQPHEHRLGSAGSSGVFLRAILPGAKTGVIRPWCSSELTCGSLHTQSRRKRYS